MTLVSRPVLGQSCATPSAFFSGNASAVGTVVICEGRTASYWINNPSSWPEPYTPDTPFDDVFGPSPLYACETLHSVLNLPDNGALDQGVQVNGHKHKKHHNDAHEPRLRGPDIGALDHPAHDAVHHQKKHGHGSLDQGAPNQGAPEPPVLDPLACDDQAPDVAPVVSEPGISGRHKKGRGSRGSVPHDQLARAVVTALLNAQAKLTPAPSVAAVKGIWKEYATQGHFEPSSGVQWGLQDILTYLASSQLG